MAERTMLVCDTCGRPAAETVTFKTSKGNRQRDFCAQHLDELLAPSRAPKRGRRPGSTRSGAGGTATAKQPRAKRTTTKPTAKRKTKAASGRKRAGTKR
jgi:hypothetical protein